MWKRIVAGQIRHLLGAGGVGFFTYLVNQGVEATDIEAIISGIVAVAMAVWSAYEKYQEEKEKQK